MYHTVTVSVSGHEAGRAGSESIPHMHDKFGRMWLRHSSKARVLVTDPHGAATRSWDVNRHMKDAWTRHVLRTTRAP